MTVKNLSALVLNGVSVVNGGKAVDLRPGSYTARMQMPMIPFSMRHPSPGYQEGQTEPPQHRIRTNLAADTVAMRAGRPGSLAGVLVSRSPARNAGRVVQLGWPIVVGEQLLHSRRLADSTTSALANVDEILPGCHLTFATANPGKAGRLNRPLNSWCGKRQTVNQAATMQAWGTSATSTWGTGAR